MFVRDMAEPEAGRNVIQDISYRKAMTAGDLRTQLGFRPCIFVENLYSGGAWNREIPGYRKKEGRSAGKQRMFAAGIKRLGRRLNLKAIEEKA